MVTTHPKIKSQYRCGLHRCRDGNKRLICFSAVFVRRFSGDFFSLFTFFSVSASYLNVCVCVCARAHIKTRLNYRNSTDTHTQSIYNADARIPATAALYAVPSIPSRRRCCPTEWTSTFRRRILRTALERTGCLCYQSFFYFLSRLRIFQRVRPSRACFSTPYIVFISPRGVFNAAKRPRNVRCFQGCTRGGEFNLLQNIVYKYGNICSRILNSNSTL